MSSPNVLSYHSLDRCKESDSDCVRALSHFVGHEGSRHQPWLNHHIDMRSSSGGYIHPLGAARLQILEQAASYNNHRTYCPRFHNQDHLQDKIWAYYNAILQRWSVSTEAWCSVGCRFINQRAIRTFDVSMLGIQILKSQSSQAFSMILNTNTRCPICSYLTPTIALHAVDSKSFPGVPQAKFFISLAWTDIKTGTL